MSILRSDAEFQIAARDVAFADGSAAFGKFSTLSGVPRTNASEHLVSRLAAAVFESLLNAIDANDPETGAHARRVAAYAVILGRAADEDLASQHCIERLGLFHDIGKINGAMFDILHGSEGLTTAERRLIATHADRGAAVVQPLAAFYPELPAGIRAHHEWWNGCGYPRRLRGRNIPLEARIVSITDVFDALTHRRSYKSRFSVTRAEDFIAAGRGTQFDPDLTDLFLSPPVRAEIKLLQQTQRARSGASPRGTTRNDRHASPPRRHMPDISFRWREVKAD